MLDRIPPQVMAYGLQQRLAVTAGSVEAVKAAADAGADLIYLQATGLRGRQAVSADRYVDLVQYCQQKTIPIILDLQSYSERLADGTA